MAKNVSVTITAIELEITVVGGQPSVNDLHDLDAAITQHERLRLEVAISIRSACDVEVHGRPAKRPVQALKEQMDS
jgi:hypothetical protein